MPIRCADWRSWALVPAGIQMCAAGQQQPAAVGAGTDADTVRELHAKMSGPPVARLPFAAGPSKDEPVFCQLFDGLPCQ
jgi:hypothetical protein